MTLTVRLLHRQVALPLFRGALGAICMRHHSLSFANRLGIPAAGISYAVTTDDWLR